MAVTRSGRAIIFTAQGDAVTGIVFIRSIQFQGSTLTAGQRLRLTDTQGSPIADYLVEAAIDNAELMMNPDFYQGITVADGPAAGSWVVTVGLG